MPTILIVDDETRMCTVLSGLFEGQGYATLTAENGKQAIEAVKEKQVNLVLLDIHLPDIDGVEVLREIKKIDESLPVIMCSGLDDGDFTMESMKFGASDYIRKPFNNDEVIQKTEEALLKKKIELPAAPGLKKKAKPLWVYGLSLVLASLVIFIITTGLILPKKEKWTVYKTPYGNPTSVAWEKKSKDRYLWVSDWLEQNIWKHNINPSLSVAKVYHFPKNYPGGLAIGNGHIWSSDASAGRIYMHIFDGNLTVSAAYKSPGPNPTALCCDKTFLWSCDADTKKIYKHRLDDNLSVVSVYASPGPFPAGIFWDGENIWSCDADTNKVYKHNMDGLLSVAGEYQPGPLADGENKISGLTFDGKNIWFALEGAGKVCKLNLDRRKF
jgi:CheY-like chemotaxis protein